MKVSIVNFGGNPVEREIVSSSREAIYFFKDDKANSNLRIRDVHVTSDRVLIYVESKRKARNQRLAPKARSFSTSS